jgi:sulfonate transport system ATP-binding protein
VSTALELIGFARRFDGPQGLVVAADAVSFAVAAGSFTALVGPSGCGKSTILRAIAGLDTHFDGAVLVGGVPVVGPDLGRGIVFQEPRLFPWLTTADNIGFGLRDTRPERDARVAELIDLVGLDGFAQAYPHQLSGGMAQRAAIARALAPRPDVLLLDEPFGALDAFTRIRLQDALQALWRTQRVTAVLVTHDIDEAIALAQQVVVLTPRPGRVREIVPIALPYPRDRGSAAFAAYRRQLLAAFDLRPVAEPTLAV